MEEKDGDVTLSTLTPEQIRDGLSKLGRAYAERTQQMDQASRLAVFQSECIDIRPAHTLVQIGLLGPCGWVLHSLSHAQIELLIQQLRAAMAGAPQDAPIN